VGRSTFVAGRIKYPDLSGLLICIIVTIFILWRDEPEVKKKNYPGFFFVFYGRIRGINIEI
jgi:hypothetical protein